MSTPWSVTTHYENFPVGSVLLPADQRPAVAALYRFARHADDVADEGDAPAGARRDELDAMDRAVRRLAAGLVPGHEAVDPLAPHARRLGLPTQPLRDLLSAFRQDVDGGRHPDFASLRDYCRRSADPVGRLVLRVAGVDDRRADALSDRICTALQLVNFAQDFARDWERGRLYIPLDELHRAGLDDSAIGRAVAGGAAPASLRALLAAQGARARAFLESGIGLVARVPRRLGWEVSAVVAGATRLCDRLDAAARDPLRARQRLRAADAPAVARLALRIHARAVRAGSPA